MGLLRFEWFCLAAKWTNGLLEKEPSAKEFRKAKKRVLIHHIPIYGNDGVNFCADGEEDELRIKVQNVRGEFL